MTMAAVEEFDHDDYLREVESEWVRRRRDALEYKA